MIEPRKYYEDGEVDVFMYTADNIVRDDTARPERLFRAIKEWIKRNRNVRVSMLIAKLNRGLRGYYGYYGVTDNTRELKKFQDAVKRLLFKWLNRRSERRSYTIDSFFNGLLKSCPIAEPHIRVSLFYR